MKISKTINSYKDELRALHGYSDTTITSYLNAVNSLMLYTEDSDVSSLNSETLKNWLINLRKEVSQNSTNTYVVAIRRYIRYLNSINACMLDQDCIKPPKRKETKVDFVGSLEVQLLIESCGYLRDKAIIATLYSTGLRNFELCNLKKTDLKSDQIQVMGKGSKPRTVFLDPYSKNLLYKYLFTRNDESEFVFINRRGDQLSPSGLRKIIRRAAEDTGILVTPHALRHGFASTLIKNGMNTRHLQYLLGHAKLETTQRYAHIQPIDVKESYRGKMDLYT